MTVIYEPWRTLPLRDFYDELRFEFNALPLELFDYYLVRTARTMAMQGNLIRRHAFIESRANVYTYRLESPDGMEVCGILGIRHNPRCSRISTEVSRSFAEPNGFVSCSRGLAWCDDEGVLHLNPRGCHGAFHVTLAVAPQQGACELPERFLTHHLHTLNLGTKASLLLISGRPWTNLSLGQAYYNEFLDRIKREAIDTATHKMRGGVRMQFGRVF